MPSDIFRAGRSVAGWQSSRHAERNSSGLCGLALRYGQEPRKSSQGTVLPSFTRPMNGYLGRQRPRVRPEVGVVPPEVLFIARAGSLILDLILDCPQSVSKRYKWQLAIVTRRAIACRCDSELQLGGGHTLVGGLLVARGFLSRVPRRTTRLSHLPLRRR